MYAKISVLSVGHHSVSDRFSSNSFLASVFISSATNSTTLCVKYKRKASKISVKIAGKFLGPARESTILCSRVLCLWEATGFHVVPSLAVYFFGSTDLSVLSSSCSSTFLFESSSFSTILRMKFSSTGSSSESVSFEGIYISLQKILHDLHYHYRFHFPELERLESMARPN